MSEECSSEQGDDDVDEDGSGLIYRSQETGICRLDQEEHSHRERDNDPELEEAIAVHMVMFS